MLVVLHSYQVAFRGHAVEGAEFIALQLSFFPVGSLVEKSDAEKSKTN